MNARGGSGALDRPASVGRVLPALLSSELSSLSPALKKRTVPTARLAPPTANNTVAAVLADLAESSWSRDVCGHKLLGHCSSSSLLRSNAINPNIDPFVAEIVSYLTGARPLPNRNTDFITTLKQAGLVPLCAMSVTRAKEGARMEPFQPSPSCSCYYESSPPGGSVPDRCKACNTAAECPDSAPNCSFGYCEP